MKKVAGGDGGNRIRWSLQWKLWARTSAEHERFNKINWTEPTSLILTCGIFENDKIAKNIGPKEWMGL